MLQHYINCYFNVNPLSSRWHELVGQPGSNPPDSSMQYRRSSWVVVRAPAQPLFRGVVSADELRPLPPVGGLHEQRPAPGFAGQQLGSAFRERRLESVERRVGGRAALWHRQPAPGRVGVPSSDETRPAGHCGRGGPVQSQGRTRGRAACCRCLRRGGGPRLGRWMRAKKERPRRSGCGERCRRRGGDSHYSGITAPRQTFSPRLISDDREDRA